jgi:Flp pilus assembly protein TadG
MRTVTSRPAFRAAARGSALLRLRGEEGSSLVETGMALLIFLPLLFGAIQFSLVFYTYHDVTDAARQAVRWAAVRGSTSCTNTPGLYDCKATSDEIQSYVRGLGYPGLVASNINVATSWLSASSVPTSWSACGVSPCNAPGNQVQVTVSYSYPISIPYWKSTSFNISSTSAMVIAQ